MIPTLNLQQEMNLCAFRVQQSICLNGFKSGAGLVGNECKTRNHCASHERLLAMTTAIAVDSFRLRRLGYVLIGVSSCLRLLFGLLIDLTCQD